MNSARARTAAMACVPVTSVSSSLPPCISPNGEMVQPPAQSSTNHVDFGKNAESGVF